MPAVRKRGAMKAELVSGERIIRRVERGRASPSALSPKHAAFCRAYALGLLPDRSTTLTIRFSAKHAAVAVGYSPRSAHNRGRLLMEREEIQREVQRLIDSTAAKRDLNAEEVLRRLDTVYARCMQAEPVIEDGSETGEYRFNAAGAIRACELIGRYLRMWQAEGQINVNVTVDQARDFARGFARRVLTLIEEHVSEPDERRRLIAAIGQEALRDG